MQNPPPTFLPHKHATMSMFSLPTTSSPSDTGVSSVRVDEFAPVSTVNADGGGTVAFECTSPANSFWCPRLSYFNFGSRWRLVRRTGRPKLLHRRALQP